MDAATISAITITAFVFISYSSENFVEAFAVYSYLKSHGINVLFDCGGLAGGSSLPEFEQNIIHQNCIKVLMIVDENYLRKIRIQQGEAWQEFDLIRNHYRSENKSKYIPVLSDGVSKNDLPELFKGQTVFEPITNLEGIVNDCKEASINSPNTISLKDAKELLKTADNLYEAKDYSLCLNYCSELLNVQCNSRVYPRLIATACNIIICMYLKDDISYTETVQKAFDTLLELMTKTSIKNDKKNYPLYLLNCSLMFQKCEKYNQEYKRKSIVFAKDALEKAIAYKFSNVYYYECHCARLYESANALNKAIKHMDQARKILKATYDGHNPNDVLTSWEIYLHGAKILIGLAEESLKGKSGKTDAYQHLDGAYEYLDYLVNNFIEMGISKAAEKELYKTMSYYYHIRENSVE